MAGDFALEQFMQNTLRGMANGGQTGAGGGDNPFSKNIGDMGGLIIKKPILASVTLDLTQLSGTAVGKVAAPDLNAVNIIQGNMPGTVSQR